MEYKKGTEEGHENKGREGEESKVGSTERGRNMKGGVKKKKSTGREQ